MVKVKSKCGPKTWIPSKEEIDKVEAMASRGLTQEQIAMCLGIHDSTLYAKRNKFPDLNEAVQRGKAKGISIVSNALFESAKSGNTTSQIFFLKCMAGWKETNVNEHKFINQEDALKNLE